MFGRTLKLAAVLVITQLSTGCCCCYRPFFCHPFCGGGCAPAPACGGCASCYTPSVATPGPMIAPLPTVSVAPTTIAPNMPPAAGSAANPIVDRVPFSSANYTHPIR